MLRWTMFLAAYNYCFLNQLGKALRHTDNLRCCLLPVLIEDPAPAPSVLLLEVFPAAPLLPVEIISQRCRAKDSLITQVRREWLKEPVEFKFLPYSSWQHKLLANHDCLLWGNQVVIPEKL